MALTQDYVVTYTDADGQSRDVTDEVTLSLALPFLGSFDGNTFQSTLNVAGRSKIHATYGDTTGEAEIAVLLTHTIIEPGGEDGPGLFEGAEMGGAAPELVYPETGIIVPPNLEDDTEGCDSWPSYCSYRYRDSSRRRSYE